MEKIRTFELDRWSEPDEQHRVRHIGMADAKETFEKLETHLKEKGMLPDEYFLYDVDMRTKARELPDFNFAMCVPNFGGSEGIYLDIDLIYCDEDGNRKACGLLRERLCRKEQMRSFGCPGLLQNVPLC